MDEGAKVPQAKQYSNLAQMIHVFRGGNDEGGSQYVMKSPEPMGPHQRPIIHQNNRVAINLHNL